jgi:glucan 1,3-beta-glucosidase
MSQPSGTGPAAYQPVSVHSEIPQDVPYSDNVIRNSGPDVLTPTFDAGSQPDLSLGNYSAEPDLPSGAARPRFMGAALAQEGIRQSYASSQLGSYTGGYDDAGSSVYALDPNSGARDSVASRGYSSVPYQDDPHDADFGGEAGGVPMAARGGRQSRYLEEKRAAYIPPKRSKRTFILGSILAALLIIVAVVIALYFTVIRKHNGTASGNTSDSSSSASPSGSSTPTNNRIKTGGDGSKVTMDDGSTFTYSNKFGGTWYYDEQDPFNNAARANSWTPPLNQSFRYGIDRIFGYVRLLRLDLLC